MKWEMRGCPSTRCRGTCIMGRRYFHGAGCLEKLERISSLSENNNLLKAEVELKEKQAQTDEHMRIYDKITEEVAPQLQKLESLLTFSEDSAKNKRKSGSCLCDQFLYQAAEQSDPPWRGSQFSAGTGAGILPSGIHGKSKALRSSGFIIVQMQRHTVKRILRWRHTLF